MREIKDFTLAGLINCNCNMIIMYFPPLGWLM